MQHQALGFIVQALGQLDSMPFAPARRATASVSPVLVHTLVSLVRISCRHFGRATAAALQNHLQ